MVFTYYMGIPALVAKVGRRLCKILTSCSYCCTMVTVLLLFVLILSVPPSTYSFVRSHVFSIYARPLNKRAKRDSTDIPASRCFRRRHQMHHNRRLSPRKSRIRGSLVRLGRSNPEDPDLPERTKAPCHQQLSNGSEIPARRYPRTTRLVDRCAFNQSDFG